MRVLVITNDFPPRVGGIQYYVEQLCRGLAAAGDEVAVLASRSDGWEAYDAAFPARVERIRSSVMLPGPAAFARSLALVRDHRPDVVVFGATFPLALMGPGLRRATGVPYVGFTHGLEVSAARAPGGRVPLRAIGAGAAAITFVSHWCEDLLRPAFGAGPEYALLPPGIDPAEYHPGVDGSPVRERYGIPADANVVCCVSRMVERKGQDQLIRALPGLRRDHGDVRLLLVGDGPHRAGLEALARQCGVDRHVHFTGKVSDEDLPAHYAAGDVFAMPCRERQGGLEVEAFGIVFLQAAAVGRPSVAGNIGGVPDALDGGRTGELVDGTSVESVAKGVGRLLADPERARRIGADAASWATSEMSWDHRVGELRQMLERAFS